MKGLLVFAALSLAVLARDTFDGHQVLRISAKDEVQLSALRDLEALDHLQLDIWIGVRDVSTPVDIRVPAFSLSTVKSHLDYYEIQYSIMIRDLQVALDEEAEEMDAATRAVEPRNTDAFDYSRYHTIEEARNQPASNS